MRNNAVVIDKPHETSKHDIGLGELAPGSARIVARKEADLLGQRNSDLAEIPGPCRRLPACRSSPRRASR
jgi:hypothetical protein